MPDITMCTDFKCDSRGTCLRYRAKPKPGWQSYFTKSPRYLGSCLYYLRLSPALVYNLELLETVDWVNRNAVPQD